MRTVRAIYKIVLGFYIFIIIYCDYRTTANCFSKNKTQNYDEKSCIEYQTSLLYNYLMKEAFNQIIYVADVVTKTCQ
jgi:hypothetical protein